MWEMPEEIGSFSLRKGGGAIVALQDGLSFFDFETGELKHLVDPEQDRPGNRFNDGKCDRQGRYWAGTMDNEETDRNGCRSPVPV